MPSQWRAQDLKNKQGSVAAPALDQKRLHDVFAKSVDASYKAYKELLAAGVAREMARMALPVNLYTEFYWTVNARSLMNFLSLRADTHAQAEIQRYAEVLAKIFAEKMPWTYDAFLKNVWKGVNPTLSAEKERLCAPQAA